MIKVRKAAENMTTWEELAKKIRAGDKPLCVGDQIDITLKDGQSVTLVCEEVYECSVRFGTLDLLADTHVMNNAWTNEGGFNGSNMYDYLNNRFIKLLPDDLQSVISGSLILLSEREVFGETFYADEEDAEQLSWYKEEGNRVKRLNGEPFPYWLRSPIRDYATSFCNVNSGGNANYTIASSSCGVAPGFCI